MRDAAADSVPAHLHRSAVQHRPRRRRGRTLPTVARRRAPATAPASAGRRYATRAARAESSYRDVFDDYLAFLEPRLREARRLLRPTGTLYFHIDYREAHYCKLLLDELFGRECFLNEIIWAYDYGGRAPAAGPPSTTRSSSTSRTRTATSSTRGVDREPYMAPGLVTAEKAARGKLPTDVVVAHDRLAHRKREDRLPDPEAGGPAATLRPGLESTGGPLPGSVRGLGTLGAVWPSRAAAPLIDSSPAAVAVACAGVRCRNPVQWACKLYQEGRLCA